MTKGTFQQTTILLGLVVPAGLFAALAADTAEAQCGCGPRYQAVPYQRPVYGYQEWAPQGCYPYYDQGYYPYYDAPVPTRQHLVPQATPQPAPNRPGMTPGHDHGQDGFEHPRAAVPEARPAQRPRPRRMVPPEPDSHPLAEAGAVAPPDIPPPVAVKPQTLAEKQRICPVTGQRLGLMGEPYKVRVKGRDVLLCCQGCETRFLRDPDKYLANLNP